MVVYEGFETVCQIVAAAEMELLKSATLDTLLDGRISLRQPAAGYRVAIDPVLLAASVPSVNRVLDVGAGVGAAALCYAWRVVSANVIGLELQNSAAELAQENVALNRFEDRVDILSGDLLRPPSALFFGGFDHVMANPPYLPPGRADPRITREKAISQVEGEATLADWIKFCLRMAAPKGAITMIHRADRLDEIIALLHGRAGGVVVFPLWPKSEVSPKRVLVRALLDSRAPLRISPGLVLHEMNDGFTEAAARVLIDAEALDL